MNKPFFSIVVPCYNAEKYIENAFSGIKNQTFDDYEVIAIDDGSKDNTRTLINDIAAINSKVNVIIHSENKGLSAARNTGIENANGEFILFLDVDDDYEKDLLKILKERIDSTNPDLVIYSLFEEYTGKSNYSIIHKRPEAFCNNIKLMGKEIAFLENETMLGYAWNKAYRLSVIKDNKLLFEKIDHIEDILFNISFLKKAKNFYVIETPLYHYKNAGTNGLTAKELPNYFELQKKRVNSFIELENSWGVDKESFMSVAAGVYFRSFASFIERNLKSIGKNKLVSDINAELDSELFSALKPFVSMGKVTGFMYKPLINKDANKALLRVKLISFVRNSFPGLYQRLKQNR